MALNNNGCIDSLACNSEHDLNPSKTDENEIDLADIIRNAMTKIEKQAVSRKQVRLKENTNFPV